jgi:collagen type VII alpha
MPLNFPLSPPLDTQYTFEDRTWVWNGRFWKAMSTTVGYTGSAGAGFTGSVGFTGSRGPAGTSVAIVGSVASSPDLPSPYGGNAGDGYIARDTGNLWVWTGSTWSNVGQIQGYTGSQGVVGSLGYTGSKGLDGFIGRDGYTGSIGFTGSQGPSGAFAGQGYTGSQGDLGYTGSVSKALLERMQPLATLVH